MIRLEALREQGSRLIRKLGWSGALGIVLLLAALASEIAMTARNAAERSALIARKLQLQHPVQPGNGVIAPPRTKAEKFYARFPDQKALPQSLAKLAEIAEANSIQVSRTEYRTSNQPGTQLLRVSLTLPLQSNYADLHAWLEETLVSMPEVALESISIRRVEAGADLVEGEVRFAVFARRIW